MAENENQNTAGQDIGQMVEQIMKNPEFTGIINELRGGDSGSVPQISQGEILSRLPDVMSMLKPLIGTAAESGRSRSPIKTTNRILSLRLRSHQKRCPLCCRKSTTRTARKNSWRH